MLEDTPIQAFMNSSREVIPWFESIQTSDPFSFGIEIAIGIIAIVITFIIFGLQLKADKKMNEVINQIDSYTGKKKKLEESRKKFYIKRIKGILNHIKTEDRNLRDFVTDLRKDPKNRHPFTRVQLEHIEENLEIMCGNAEQYLLFLEPFLTDPQIAEVMMEYLDKFYEPYSDLIREKYWELSHELFDHVDEKLDLHLHAIDKYLGLLSNEETDVTNHSRLQVNTPDF